MDPKTAAEEAQREEPADTQIRMSEAMRLKLALEDWWEGSQELVKSLFKHSITSDQRFQSAIETAHKLECLGVGLLQCFEVEAREEEKANQYFLNLLRYIQRNHVSLALLINSKLPMSFKAANKWALRLQSFLAERGQDTQMRQFSVSNECIKNIAQNIIAQFMVPDQDGPSAVYQQMLNKLYRATLANIGTLQIPKAREIVFNLQYAELTSPERLAVFSGLGIDLSEFIAKPKFVVPKRQRSSSTKKNTPAKDPSAKAKEEQLAAQSPSNLQAAMFDWDSLPKVTEPFLPPKEPTDHEYTLVLDLDETLIHYMQGAEEQEGESFFLIRPGCGEFLSSLAKYFELVIFTAAMQDYADTVIDQIDPERLIKHRLYRQHTTFSGGSIVKDLSRIGRDIRKAILVDNVSENFCNQKENGIFIKTWYDDMEDRQLFELIPLLRQIVENKCQDVRKVLTQYRDYMLRKIIGQNGALDSKIGPNPVKPGAFK